jgi:NADH-quinone oxidoreductase subunit L
VVNAAYFILALPLAGFLINIVFGRRLGEPLAGWVGTLAAAGSFVATVLVWITMLGRIGPDRYANLNIFTWFPVAGLHASFGIQIDPLSLTMALFVTGVSTLIHLYSIGYMHGDPGFSRFFVYLNLFLFSMVCLVLANNFLFTFLGWEGVGFCSYGLVGFWFERESAAVAAKKAFITNRAGDFGFLLAIFLMFAHFGSVNFSDVLGTFQGGQANGLMLGAPGAISGTTATAISLLLFLGACGKSAQLPLYMWLPDAMEGPTPVSALIHAATMVTAGVYLMARAAPLLHYAHAVSWVIVCIGAATSIFAATIACAQNDIKRCLAYSTLSQLGYMFMGIGSGDYADGLFHMITHAFFKALLFLAAGSVIHAMRDEQDMKRMGALSKYLPITGGTFLVGWLAISGIPPFAGFWSKDAILSSVWHMNKGLWVVGAVTAGLTAYYMSRQFALVFRGQARWQEHRPAVEGALVGVGDGHGATEAGGSGSEESHGAAHQPGDADAHGSGHGLHGEPHESPWIMTLPLVILAAGAAVGGLINLPYGHFDFLTSWLSPVFASGISPAIHVATDTKILLSVVTTALAVVGLGLGLSTWRTPAHPKLEPAVLRRGWYIDDSVSALVGGPLAATADGIAYGVDAGAVDGAVNGVARSLALTGRGLRRLQSGYIRTYVLGITAGIVVVLGYVAARIGS